MLGSGISDQPRGAAARHHRTDQHHPTAPRLLERRHGGPHDPEHCSDIHRQRPIPQRIVVSLDLVEDANPRARDHPVDAAHGSLGGSDDRFGGARRSDVDLQIRPFVLVGREHRRPVMQQPPHRRLPDPRRAARHHEFSSRQIGHPLVLCN